MTGSTQLLSHPGHNASYYERQHAVIAWARADRSVILQNRQLFESALAR